jgi:hypothetical protein
MHGGGGGAPPGNQNAVTHGYFSAKAIHQRSRETELFRDVRTLLDDPNALSDPRSENADAVG